MKVQRRALYSTPIWGLRSSTLKLDDTETQFLTEMSEVFEGTSELKRRAIEEALTAKSPRR